MTDRETPMEADLAERLSDAALLAPADLGVDLEVVRRRGRNRRRTRVGLTAAAAVVAVGGAATAVVLALPGAPVTVTPGAPPTSRPSASASAPIEPTETAEPIGAVIDTDTPLNGGTLALWFERSPVYNGRLMAVLGARTPAGLVPMGQALDFEGPGDLAPGFHLGYDAQNGTEPRAYTLFGYVVGDNITHVRLTVNGTEQDANVATWSESPKVHVWWLIGEKQPNWPARPATVTNLHALDDFRTVLYRAPDGSISHG